MFRLKTSLSRLLKKLSSQCQGLHLEDQGGALPAARQAQGTQEDITEAQAGRRCAQDGGGAQDQGRHNNQDGTATWLPKEPLRLKMGNTETKIYTEQTRVKKKQTTKDKLK